MQNLYESYFPNMRNGKKTSTKHSTLDRRSQHMTHIFLEDWQKFTDRKTLRVYNSSSCVRPLWVRTKILYIDRVNDIIDR